LKVKERRRRVHVLWVALIAAMAAVAGAPAVSAGAEQPAPEISAAAVSLSLPDQDALVLAAAGAPPQAAADELDWGAPDTDAPLVTAHRAITTVSATDQATEAAVTLRGLRLWGGEVRVRELELSVHVDATGATPRLVMDGLAFDRLVAPGLRAAWPLEPGVPFPVADWGTLTTGEQATDGSSIVALRLELTADHRGLPAGTVLTAGIVAIPEQAPPVDPGDGGGGTGSGGGGKGDSGGGGGSTGGGATTGGGKGGDGAGSGSGGHHQAGTGGHGSHEGSGGGKTKHQQPPKIHLPPKIHAHLTHGGFVFPVWGPVSFSDDFGAPRADTVWHHGNDLFAARGAPVLAVTDGTLRQVGWNTLGGQRLWLEADDGSVSFYYAHLDAFAPVARDGARVNAGDVIGFVGNTGDAAGTPYHLHFEVHPTALERLGYDGVIDPYMLLLAWKHLKDAPISTGKRVRHDQAVRPPERAAARLLARPEGSAAHTSPPVPPVLSPDRTAGLRNPDPRRPKRPADIENTLAIRENALTDLVRAMRRGGG
jgi:murein DD-endopeptidase MepM/ murein hydrolase activator NlpD